MSYYAKDIPFRTPDRAVRYAEMAGFDVDKGRDGDPTLASRDDMDTYFTLKEVGKEEWVWYRPDNLINSNGR